MKEWRTPEYPEKTPDDKLQSCRLILTSRCLESIHFVYNGLTCRGVHQCCVTFLLFCFLLCTWWHDNLLLWKLQVDLSASLSDSRLAGLVVKASASRAEDPGFKSSLHQDFSRLSDTSDLKIGTPVAILPGTWCYRASDVNGWPGVRILWLGEMESLICGFCLSVAARKIVWADCLNGLILRYALQS